MQKHMNGHVIEYLKHRLIRSMRKDREVRRIKRHAVGNVYYLADKDKPLPLNLIEELL